MGALQVEVKVLKQAPLLFAWENKDSNEVHGYLITCPCQQLGLQRATGDAKISSVFQGGDEEWAKRLARALEISEVVSFSSMGSCSNVWCNMTNDDDVVIPDDGCRKKKKRKKTKRSSKKKEKLKDRVNRVSDSDASHKEEGGDIDSDGVAVQEQSMVTGKPEVEQTQDESQSSIQEDMSTSSGELPKEKVDFDNSKAINENPDTVEEPGSHVGANNNNPTVLNLDNASKESPSVASSDVHHDDEDSSIDDVQDHTKDLSTSKYEEDVNHSEDQIHTISEPMPLPHGLVNAIDKDHSAIAHVTLASDVPASEEDSIMKAITSIMEIYPGAVIDVQETVHEKRQAENANKEMNQSGDKPDFIRALTEEERKTMFRFQSDVVKENLKRLQAGGRCFLCEHCGKVITNGRRKKHMETHSTQPRTRDVSCEQCGRSFFDRISLSHHMKTHSSEPRFKCRYCAKKYKSLFGRTLHERAHFQVYAGICSQCGRKFLNNNKYQEHLTLGCAGVRRRTRTFKGRREFEGYLKEGDPGTSTCELCGKVLRTGSMLSHMEFHEGKMFQCPVCHKSVKFSSRYAHLKIHSEERNYVCNVCNKAFKTQAVLNTHMRTHTGERPLKCRYCGKGFSRYTSRSVHETIHTGERPFVCTICNKGWKDRATYMAHMKKHHPGKPVFYKRKSSQINQLISLQNLKEKQDDMESVEDS